MTALYKDGTVTLVQGSPVIVGNDTGWKVALIVGGTVFVEAEGGAPLPILPDDSDGANLHPITNTQMTAAINWTGASGTYNYALVRDMSYSRQQSANADALALYLQRLNNPSLAAVSGLVPEVDSLILFTGPDTATVIQRSSLVQGVDYDADADNIAGRNLYSSEAKGFSVLVANAGDGRTAIFIKRSSTDGDWSQPFYLSGPIGPKGDTGATGIIDAGVYSATSAYSIRDAVLDNGSTWLAKSAVPPGNPPPVLPAVQNDYWRLLARRGIDGTGIGDVIGPANAVAGDFVQFANGTGKEISVAQIASPALIGRVSSGVGAVERLSPAQANKALGGWEPIGLLNLAGLSVGNVLNLSEFAFIRCVYSFQNPTTNGDCYLQVSTNNGASWFGDIGNYRFNILYTVFANSTTVTQNGDGDLQGISLGGYMASGEVIISAFNKAAPSQSVGTQMVENPSNRQSRIITHRLPGNTGRNAIRVACPSNNTRAEFYFEGIRG